MGDVRVLSFHAPYACRHRGACCTAHWPIPIEADRLAALRAALASGRVRPTDERRPPLLFPADAPEATPALIASGASGCVFLDTGDGRCRIHRALGHDALPLACRQFPRVSLVDPRGVSVTLSHYCPTAAAMLEDTGDIAIVSAAPSFPAGGEYVGLDATSSLPPLLRADMAMDWASWWEWERLAVRLIGTRADDPHAALTELAAIVEDVRRWRPSEGMLVDRMRRAFATEHVGGSRADRDGLVRDVVRAVPDDIPATAAPSLENATAEPTPACVAARFVAAHAFANWTAHLGTDLRAWCRSVDAALALLDAGYGVRHADLLLRHLTDPHALAETWSA